MSLSIAILLFATQAEPPEAMTLARAAYEQARAGRMEEAAAGLQKAGKLAPSNPLYRSALGGLFEKMGRTEEAVAAFGEAARLDPANAAFRERLEKLSLAWGETLAREQRYRAGLAHARETAKRFPGSAPAHLMLGLFAMRNQENLAAVEAYGRAAQLDPQSAEANVGLGIAQTAAGLAAAAQATFEAGLKKFPGDAVHRQAYGVLLVKLAESGAATDARAAAMFESALKLDASLAEPHYQLGNLALAKDDAAGAAAHFEAAAANGLNDARLHYAAARALRRLGRTGEAEKHMEAFRNAKSR